MSVLSVRIVSGAVAVKPTGASKDEIFSFLADMAVGSYGLEKNMVVERLTQREALGSTGFGGAVAIPHAKIDGLEKCVGLFVRLENPMSFDAHDAQPVDLVFCLLSPVQGGADHLKALAEISRFLRDDDAVGKLRGANSADALYVLLTGLREQRAA
ncbi:PTS sugar transporter subunit IIA [Parasphingorhabdus sp.]|uniref:PTS sugar transporter subunit IIA n=1 Tax=Parasphingorhabdus sp. TaxID=2709688 RepID=UPI0032632D55